MAKNRLTVFQTLERALKGNFNSDQGFSPHINSYDMSGTNSVIYKTQDKDEYDRTKLELQQNAYLKDRWIRANVDLSVSAFAGLSNIKLMYRDADLMDSFPEIGAALDLVSEESTLNSEEKGGGIVNVYSKSERIKAILEDLFVNRLNLQVTAPMIVRAMCKYGNQFMMLDIDNKLGVKGWKQLPVFNVERLENGIQNPYGTGMSLSVNNLGHGGKVSEADLSTKFVWTDEQNSQVPFRNWQIAHFRLLTNSMCLPYGCLVGDTRIETEFGYKEIDQIVSGDKVWTFNVDTQERELGTVTVTQFKGVKQTFKLSTKHYEVEATDDHKFLTYTDKKLAYKELKDLKIGDLLICDNFGNKLSKEIEIDKTDLKSFERGQKSVTWWTDYIDNVPNYVDADFARLFGFLLGDGWLSHGYHVMFALGVHPTINERYIKLLEKYSGKGVSFVPQKENSKRLLPFHTAFVGSKMFLTILKRMGFSGHATDKRIPSWVYKCNDTIKEAFLDGLMDADGTCKIVSPKSLCYTIELANKQLIKDVKVLAQSLGYRTNKISYRNRIGRFSTLENGETIVSRNESFYTSFYKDHNSQEKSSDIKNRLTNIFKVEKITGIVPCGENKTYDITIEGNNNSNFFANGIVTHNCSYLNAARRHWRMLSLMEDMMLIYRLERSIERRVFKIYVGAIDDADVTSYVEQIANNFKRTPIVDPITGQLDLRKNILDVSQDFFIPVRDQSAPTPIDTLPAAQNLTAMDDIKFVQNKVLTALRIPKSFLNFEENSGDGKNLALMDVRFTRVINRIQQAFLMELTKVACIHLYLLGFEDDLTNFNLTMNNPSTQAEQLEIDNMQKKISAVRDAVSDPGNGLPVMSQTRALKQIMKWSDKEIKENLEEIRLEKAISAELEKTVQIIKRTGIFDTVDRIYGEPGAEYQEDMQQGGPGDMGGGMPGGAGGGGGFGGGLDDLGAPGADDQGDIAGAEGSEPTADMNGGDSGADNMPPPPGVTESKVSDSNLLIETIFRNADDNKKAIVNRKNKLDSLFEAYMNRIDNNIKRKAKPESVIEKADIYDKTLMINEEYSKMINSLDTFINDDREADE